MSNSEFKFKQFSIQQTMSAMKVGTDGVLLGAWATANHNDNILDIGTGTGLISLMMAQRFNANIIGLEIEQNSYKEAIENINKSKWKDRIDIKHTSFQEFANSTKRKFESIVTNPPYFINSLKSRNNNRNIARHTELLSFVDLLNGVKKTLADNGKFSLIIPFNQKDSFIEMAKNNLLYCAKQLIVKPKHELNPKRILMEFSFNKSEVESNLLVIENKTRHDYTRDYINLTKDFYLKF